MWEEQDFIDVYIAAAGAQAANRLGLSLPTRVALISDSVGHTGSWLKVGGDEVGDLRLRRSAQPADGILKDSVCVGDAMVLSEMF